MFGKFLRHKMMVKDSKNVEDLDKGNILNTEPQVVAFKATSKKEEGAPSKKFPINTSKLDDEEMSIVSFRFL
jgi:hypothetical protein